MAVSSTLGAPPDRRRWFDPLPVGLQFPAGIVARLDRCGRDQHRLSAPSGIEADPVTDPDARRQRRAGADTAVDDNNTTGKFLDQQFALEDERLADGQDAAAATATLAKRGVSLVIADLPADAFPRAPAPRA